MGNMMRQLWERLQQPTAIALVLCIGVGRFFSWNENVLNVFMTAFGVIVLILLSELRPERPEKISNYRSVLDAKNSIAEQTLRWYRMDKEVVIQYIGMTMYNAWDPIEAVLDELWSQGIQKVRLEVAMSDSNWLHRNRIRALWTPSSADNHQSRIQNYFGQRLGRSWTCEVKRYAHMPCVHGCLINNRVAFVGMARWERLGMKAGDRLFEFLDETGTDIERTKIATFRSWFQVCFSEGAQRTESRKSTGGSSLTSERRGADPEVHMPRSFQPVFSALE